MILITGASDGLGLQLAKLYKEAGKKVVNISRNNSEYADERVAIQSYPGWTSSAKMLFAEEAAKNQHNQTLNQLQSNYNANLRSINCYLPSACLGTSQLQM